MKKTEFIDKQLAQLEKRGSNFSLDQLRNIRKSLVSIIDEKRDFAFSLETLIEEIKETNFEMLETPDNVITGLSNTIYLPGKATYKVNVTGGTNTSNQEITEDTLFDIASVTKLFSVLLVLKLVENGVVNLNDKIRTFLPGFKINESFTLEDILYMTGSLKSDGRLAINPSKEAPVKVLSQEEIDSSIEIAKTIYSETEDREKREYSDMGFIILKFFIESIYKSKTNCNLNFDEIMKKEFLEPLGMDDTVYNPSSNKVVAGNGNQLNLVHDPKARYLGGVSGHAGLFTTSKDFTILADSIFSMSKDKIDKITKHNFFDKFGRSMGIGGIYLKNKVELESTHFAPHEFSSSTFAHQGWTGSFANFDYTNKIHNSYLINAIAEDEVNKNAQFFTYFRPYIVKISESSIKLLILKKYQEMVGNLENIDSKITLCK